MSESCVMYSERTDYGENEVWRYYITGKELCEKEGRNEN